MAAASTSLLQSLFSPFPFPSRMLTSSSISGRCPAALRLRRPHRMARSPPSRVTGVRRRSGGHVRAAYVSAPAADPDPVAKDESPAADVSSAPPAAISWSVIWSLLSRHKIRLAVSLASLVGCTSCTLAMPIFSGNESYPPFSSQKVLYCASDDWSPIYVHFGLNYSISYRRRCYDTFHVMTLCWLYLSFHICWLGLAKR